MQNDRLRMQSAVLRSAKLLAALTLPLGIGVSAMAEELVPLLYGDQWLPMVPALGMFGLSAALRASMAISSPLFNAHDRVGLALRYNVISTLLTILGVWVSLPYGISVVATAVALVSLYSLVPFVAALRLIGLGAVDAARILLPPALAAGCFWVVITWARPELRSWSTEPALLLAASSAMALPIYAAVLHALSRDCYQEIRRLVARI